MSNNQWNNGPADGQSQPQGEWAPAPQTSANDAPGTQPQQSASDWNTGQQSQDWSAGAQQQDWNTGNQAQPGWDPQQQQQGWAPQQQQQQGWDPQQQQQGWDHQQQGGSAPAGQQVRQPRTGNAFSNVFDFSFKKFALPEAGGTIFLIASIAILVKWLFDLVVSVSFGTGAAILMRDVIGGLATAFLYILLVRVFLEGMSALVMRSQQDKNKDTKEA